MYPLPLCAIVPSTELQAGRQGRPGRAVRLATFTGASLSTPVHYLRVSHIAVMCEHCIHGWPLATERGTRYAARQGYLKPFPVNG